MGTSSLSAVLGAQVRNEIIAEIEARAAAISVAKGRYATLIFEWWAAQGYPAVTPADQAMQDLAALARAKVAEGKPSSRRTA